MALGYSSGQPFGDPSRYTRSTGEGEIDRFNQWMRAQPWWRQARALKPYGEMTDQQRAVIAAGLRQAGVRLPQSFIVDTGGNLNQTNRLDDIAKWSAIAAGTAAFGFGLAGMGPLGALGAGAGAPGVTGGAAGGAAAGGGASGALPAFGPLAGGYAGATTAATVPASLAAAGGGGVGLGALGTGAGAVAGGGSAARNVLNAAGTAADVAREGRDWVSALGPLLGLGTSLALGAGRGDTAEIDPDIKAKVLAGLDLQQQRVQATQPVHAAAMQLAQNLAPTYTNSPRLTSAISDATRMAPVAPTDPGVLAAVQRLMGR